MSDPLQALLAPLGLVPTAFPPSSRYHGARISSVTTRNGETIAYLARRFAPQPDSFQTLQLVTVRDGDRLDRLSAQYLGDPLAFWRLCDANGALRPNELVERPGRELRITLPAGVPGGVHA